MSSVKKFYKYFSIPGIGQLAGGKSPFYTTSMYPVRRVTAPCPQGFRTRRHVPS
jgi:hypothetical protein